eukprot:4947954-Pyramimonas_sp.AAC.1
MAVQIHTMHLVIHGKYQSSTFSYLSKASPREYLYSLGFIISLHTPAGKLQAGGVRLRRADNSCLLRLSKSSFALA